MRQPLVPPVLALVAGILAADRLDPAPGPAAAACLASAALFLAGRTPRTPVLLLVWFFAGMVHLAVSRAPLSPLDLRRASPESPVLGRLEVELIEPPREPPVEPGESSSGRITAQARAIRWTPQFGEASPVHGRVLVRGSGAPVEHLWAGRRLIVDGILRPPAPARAPGLFDARRHLAVRGIHRELFAAEPADWTLSDPAPATPPTAERLRRAAHATLQRGLPDDASARLLRGMVLGWRGALTDELEEPFLKTGTLHLFAISGLHLALVAALFIRGLALFRIPRAACGLLALPAVWGFVVVTGNAPSAIRAAVMATVVTGAWALRRPNDLLNSLALAAGILLAWDPGQLFHIGFQFSFAVVAGLILIVPPLGAALAGPLRPDPLVPDEHRSRAVRWLAGPARAVAAAIATTLAAFLAGLPLTVGHFHLVNPVALPANLVMVPLSGLAMTAGVGSLAAAAVAPPLVPWLNQSAWFWLEVQLAVARALAATPGGAWWAASPGGMAWTVYVAAIGLALAFPRLTARWRRAGLAALALGIATVVIPRLRPDPRLHLTVLPAGAAIVIRSPEPDGNVVLDAGTERVVRSVTLPHLQSLGWNSLPAHAVTHGEKRFSGGAPALLDALPAREVAVPAIRLRGAAIGNHAARLSTRATPPRPLGRGTSWHGWEVLHPDPSDPPSRADDHAVVLHRSFDGVRILLLSGLGRTGQRRLLERHPDLRADLVVASVPTDGVLLPDRLLDRLGATRVVVSAADYPAAARGSRADRERLRSRAGATWFTDESGAVSLAVGGRGVEVATGDQVPARP